MNCTSFILNTRKDKKTRSLLTKRKLPSERIKCSSGRYCNYVSDGDGSCHSIYYKKKYSKNDGTAEEDTSFCSDCPGGYFAQRQKEWGNKHDWSYSTSCTPCESKFILKSKFFFFRIGSYEKTFNFNNFFTTLMQDCVVSLKEELLLRKKFRLRRG